MGKARMARTTTAALELPAMVKLVVELCRGLVRDVRDPYRPERHYMRGPGPAWQAKHATLRSRPLDRTALHSPLIFASRMILAYSSYFSRRKAANTSPHSPTG